MGQELPLYTETKPSQFGVKKVLGLGVAALIGYTLFQNSKCTNIELKSIDYCPLVDKLVPEYAEELSDLDYFKSDEYRNVSLKLWADAVRIPTSNFDDLGEIGQDPRWDIFYKFEEYLIKAFPEVTKHSAITKVNTHGLVYKIEGSDKNLQPIMLCGHQDVVPVPDDGVSRWTYPPFAGVFDGEFLWGRGSSDCKNNVIGMFEAIEILLIRGYKPKRTVVLALGFDEETSGLKGATQINEYLLEKMGANSIFMIIDEGGLGIQDINGARVALPATGEKGYVDIEIELITTGGHSSVPPKHTGIGMIADLIHEIEVEDYPLDLTPQNPFFYQLQCEAKGSKTMDAKRKKDIRNIAQDLGAKNRVLKDLSKELDRKALVSTTQAVDIIYGGLKINALPERVTVKVNHRVSYESSIDDVKAKILNAVKTISDRFSIDIEAYGETIKEFETSSGVFRITAKEPLSPAPLTPTIDNPSWEVLGGTIRHVFEDFAEYRTQESKESNREVLVSPSCMTGNTDTRHYWNLTKNIYRFTPIRQAERFNAHAIDERVSLSAHIEGVVFFYELLRNLNT